MKVSERKKIVNKMTELRLLLERINSAILTDENKLLIKGKGWGKLNVCRANGDVLYKLSSPITENKVEKIIIYVKTDYQGVLNNLLPQQDNIKSQEDALKAQDIKPYIPLSAQEEAKKGAMLFAETIDQYLFNEKVRKYPLTPSECIDSNKTILDEAKDIIYGDREKDYGTVTDNFTKIAKIWSAIIDKEVTPVQVGLMMAGLKIARQCFKDKHDNLVDAIGYIACIDKMKKGL